MRIKADSSDSSLYIIKLLQVMSKSREKQSSFSGSLLF